jgi:hypothetical protein
LFDVSHTAEVQTRAPVAVVHAPTSPGNDVPFGNFGVHTLSRHHFVASLQSLSIVHGAPHAPVVVLQDVPAWPVQSLFD